MCSAPNTTSFKSLIQSHCGLLISFRLDHMHTLAVHLLNSLFLHVGIADFALDPPLPTAVSEICW